MFLWHSVLMTSYVTLIFISMYSRLWKNAYPDTLFRNKLQKILDMRKIHGPNILYSLNLVLVDISLQSPAIGYNYIIWASQWPAVGYDNTAGVSQSHVVVYDYIIGVSQSSVVGYNHAIGVSQPLVGYYYTINFSHSPVKVTTMSLVLVSHLC